MGHVPAKDLYRRLGGKIDGMGCRVPFDETLRAILKALYSEAEADLVVRMPYGLCDLARLEESTGLERSRLAELLDGLTAKGLVLDLWAQGRYFYAPSPFVIGIFEFTLMRTRGRLDTGEWAKLFHDYMEEGSFWDANFGRGEKVSILRAVPQDGSLPDDGAIEVLDYEKASAIVDRAGLCAVGLCACRHEKQHLGRRTCDVPLETCTSFGFAADYLVRHGLAREIPREEMRELFARSRDRGLVLCADNVQRGISYVCHCCKCCCMALAGINRHGYDRAIVTSGFLAAASGAECAGCGLCAKACPVEAVRVVDKVPVVDASSCLGCGVCVLKCGRRALKLGRRSQRVIPPETIFEKVILQSLEKDTLQNQLFDDPASLTHGFLRAFLGGFLRLAPVKKALASDALRSRFLAAMKAGARWQGKGGLTEL